MSTYKIDCPSSRCEKEGFFSVDEIETLVGKDLTDKHKTSKLETGMWYSK